VLKVEGGEQSNRHFMTRRSWVNLAAGLVILVLGAYTYPSNNLFGILVMLVGVAILADALGIIR
jgi:hypothetical protein